MPYWKMFPPMIKTEFFIPMIAIWYTLQRNELLFFIIIKTISTMFKEKKWNEKEKWCFFYWGPPRVVPGPAAAAAKISSEGMHAVITLCLPGEGRTTSFISSSYSIKPFDARSFFSYKSSKSCQRPSFSVVQCPSSSYISQGLFQLLLLLLCDDSLGGNRGLCRSLGLCSALCNTSLTIFWVSLD